MNDNNSSFTFGEIPNEYQLLKDNFNSEILKNLYSKFNFKYINCKNQTNPPESFLNDFLPNYKFITFAYSISNKESENLINAIFCVENQCLIIELVNKKIIENIIENIKSVFIDASAKNNNAKFQNNDVDQEISSFCKFFSQEIKTNSFLKYTIRPIIAFIIRRNFYPSNFFTNPDFFKYEKETEQKNQFKTLNSEELLQKVEEDKRKIKENNQIEDFKEDDFINLRTIFVNSYALFSLALHKKSFCIFMMKRIESYYQSDSQYIKHEIDFCSKYSNQYFTRFYGFIKENEKIKGLIYEYMCNGNLEKFILKHQNDLDEFFSFTTMTRIIQAIRYLHSNSLIYRDLKPDNILINHDFIPYLSDFDTIREIETDMNSSSKEKTQGLGSIRFISPEQYYGNDYSFPTDIYSLGLVIYFIYEKKFMFDTVDLDKNYDLIKKEFFPKMESTPSNIQNIIKQCVKINPKDRLSIDLVERKIFEEASSFYFLQPTFLEKMTQLIKKPEIHQFFKEMYNLIFVLHDDDDLEYSKNHQIQLFELLYLSTNSNIMNLLNEIGEIYFKGDITQENYQKAKEHFLIPASKGDDKAQLYLGFIYQLGDEKDYTKAREYYEKSALQNNPRAITYLGIIYIRSIGVERDLVKAKEYFELGAKYDNPIALLYLGIMYGDGLGVEQDRLKGLEYFELSAKQNNKDAIKCLVTYFYEDLFSSIDYAKAKKYFELGVKNNDSRALCGLGRIYKNGFGVAKDLAKAKEYFELSSQQNNSDGSLMLGDLYRDGEGVEQNLLKAKELYGLSYQQNNKNMRAVNRLGLLYFTGKEIKQDFAKAKKLFEIAAENNDPEAQNNLGIMYYSGQGVEKDYKKAKEYFELSAEQDTAAALNCLGVLYQHGYGVNKDYAKAKQYYELSAKQEDPNAQINLGIIYKNALGTEQDYDKAKYYFELAGKQNNPIGFYKIGKLYYHGNGFKKDYDQARKYFELAAKEQYQKAFYMLGIMYKNGQGVERNYQKAKLYFELSAAQNNSDAIYQIGTFYFYGYISEIDYKKAREYFEMSAQKKNLNSLFYLGLLYEKGSGVERNIEKAIEYYKQCSSNKKNGYISKTNSEMFSIEKKKIYNDFYYRSNNDLGLIFITEKEFQNLELANKYIKEAGLNEYPYGQNNFGLFNQYFLNEMGNAQYMYERSSKNHFALAEFNLAEIYEKEGKIKESIEHYIKASDYENEQFVFRNKIIEDERLDISKTFIICFTNLKIANYYNLNESKSSSNEKLKSFYFLKSIFCPLFALLFHSTNKSFQFHLKIKKINGHDIISNINELILNNPVFHSSNDITNGWTIQEENLNLAKLNLIIDQNQPNISDNSIHNEKEIDEKTKKMNEIFSNNESLGNYCSNNENDSEIFRIFEFLNKQNQFEIIQKDENKSIDDFNHFIRFKFKESKREQCLIYPISIIDLLINTFNENNNLINDVIEEMSRLIFTPPFSILFGRIKIYSTNEETNQIQKTETINKMFYDGFGDTL